MGARILITGGGTGGHIYPAIATIEALKGKDEFEFLFVGGKKGIEMNIVPRYGIAMRSIWISGFQRYFTMRNLLFPIKLMVSLFQSRRILREFNPAVVVGIGGYVTGPVLYVASKMGVPVLMQEQDVYPGVTSRLLKKHANRICLAFEGAKKYFEDYLEKVVVTGNPVRKNLQVKSKIEAVKKWKLDPNKPVIFVFGGSQGSRAINQALVKILPRLIEEYDVQIIWQSGQREYTSVINSEVNFDDVKIFPFIHEMEDAYSAADVIISRAGAITIAELAIVEKPVILVPYPFAAGKHQEQNARFIQRQEAALTVQEGGGWEEELYDRVSRLLTDKPLRNKMAAAWKKLARPDAADRIADEVTKLIATSWG